MKIESYRELRVFQGGMGLCMEIFEITKRFPTEERFSLVDQIRRSSRSVCANLAEAWHRRRYPAAFSAKLCDAESEASETQVWVNIARRCGYLATKEADRLDAAYNRIIAQIVCMVQESHKWTLNPKQPSESDASKSSSSVSHVPPLSRSPVQFSPVPPLPRSPARIAGGAAVRKVRSSS